MGVQNEESEILKNKGNEAFKSEKYDEALSLYSKAISLAEEIAENCDRALEIVPEDPKALFRRAQALNFRKRFVEIKGLLRLLEVCSELEEYKYESAMNITPSSRTIAACLARIYENMYYDQARERFNNQIDDFVKNKLLTPDLESKVRVTVAITSRGPLDVAKDQDMKWAAEGLSYLTLDADVKEKLVEDNAAIQALIELAKTGDQSALYGVVTTLVNLCNAYDKQEFYQKCTKLLALEGLTKVKQAAQALARIGITINPEEHFLANKSRGFKKIYIKLAVSTDIVLPGKALSDMPTAAPPTRSNSVLKSSRDRLEYT
ncbi:Protein unc-45 homolog B [Eumeta japonica]|uniref:Protein unc-45 homolog B n=1 Tax=Eumeta variegata TaxID=151549 RepID=A0A4C2A040_EUMVA|nr:Protein unc-45 homolog B [Eumeta japonica]